MPDYHYIALEVGSILLDSLLQSTMYCYKGVVLYEPTELNDWTSPGTAKPFILSDRSPQSPVTALNLSTCASTE